MDEMTLDAYVEQGLAADFWSRVRAEFANTDPFT
jgi:hypothetical protein